MNDSERKGLSSLHLNSDHDSGSHLAHWPPPMRAKETKPILAVRRPGPPAQRAERRGWRLTRAMFAEFEDDD